MKDHQIKLIDNKYNQEEARDLLMALINDKIKFLQLKIFSIHERFGTDTTHLEKRIAELKEEKNQLLLKLGKLKDKACIIDIDCSVNLKIEKEESAIV